MSGPPFTMSKYVNETELLRDKCAWLEGQLAEQKGALSDVTSKVREIHGVMKRGDATEDHGLDGNLACILDSVCTHKEGAVERKRAEVEREEEWILKLVEAHNERDAAMTYAVALQAAGRRYVMAANKFATCNDPQYFLQREIDALRADKEDAERVLLDLLNREIEIGTGNPKPVGRCATTQTERYRVEGCTCPTYPGNEGLPCLTWCQSRAADRCAYCDHNLECHRRLSAMFKGSHAVGILQCSVCGALGTPSCSREGCPARNDALDAMRYRWIRNRWDDWSGLTWARPIPPKLDAAIDEAMQGCHSQVPKQEADRG